MSNPYQRNHRRGSVAYNLANDRELQLSQNFQLWEFASKDGTLAVLVHPALLELLEEIRSRCGDNPIKINSGYRSHAHNANVSNATRSRHPWGMAADIVVRGVDQSNVWEVCKELDPGGLAKEASFIHVDVEGKNRRWSYG